MGDMPGGDEEQGRKEGPWQVASRYGTPGPPQTAAVTRLVEQSADQPWAPIHSEPPDWLVEPSRLSHQEYGIFFTPPTVATTVLLATPAAMGV